MTITALACDEPAMFFPLYDENNLTILNGTIEFIFYYGDDTNDTINKVNGKFEGVNNISACTNSSLFSMWTLGYGQLKYYAPDSSIEYYNIVTPLHINGTVQTFALYDITTASGEPYTINLISSDQVTLDNAIVQMRRKYVDLDEYLIVEAPLTDNAGSTIGNFVPITEIYDFYIYLNGSLVGIFKDYKITSTINLYLSQATITTENFAYMNGVGLATVFNQTLRTLNTYYTMEDGNQHSIARQVVLNNGYENDTICSDNFFTATSGVMTCTIPVAYGDVSLYQKISIDGNLNSLGQYSFGSNANDILGGTRVVIGILLFATLPFLFIVSPVLMVVVACIAMILMQIFHVVDGGSIGGNTMIVLWFIVAGGILIMHLVKRR
jgi:hypothetical protein